MSNGFEFMVSALQVISVSRVPDQGAIRKGGDSCQSTAAAFCAGYQEDR